MEELKLAYIDSDLQMDTNLILCIEEIDKKNILHPIDNRIFIGWDISCNSYYIRGKRQDINKKQFVPYAFCCHSTKDLYEILDFILGKDLFNIILYNYNNMDNIKSNDLPYEFFEKYIDKSYEIAGYNAIKFNKKILKFIRILKNTYNVVQEL
jgi:hypothetical protein